jgi:hypothetical protein
VHAGDGNKITKYVTWHLDSVLLHPAAAAVLDHPAPDDADGEIVMILAGNLTGFTAYAGIRPDIET